MALPRLNESPKHEMVIPSSGKTVRFRPYLVKEEKVLLIAFENGDVAQAMKAIIDTIFACVDDDITIQELTTFDVEYMFTQIRAKSVGETSTINVKCQECSHDNEYSVNLQELAIEIPERENVIELLPEVSVEMKYPGADSFLSMKAEATQTETVLELVANSIAAVLTEEERIDVKDETRQMMDEFIDSLTGEQFKKVSEYVMEIPTLKKGVEFDCGNCGHHNKTELTGFTDFF